VLLDSRSVSFSFFVHGVAIKRKQGQRRLTATLQSVLLIEATAQPILSWSFPRPATSRPPWAATLFQARKQAGSSIPATDQQYPLTDTDATKVRAQYVHAALPAEQVN
jgi:hypothetical protein